MQPMVTAKPACPVPDLPRRLGLVDATAVVVGTMIGTGIFLVPSVIARNLPSEPMILAAWGAAGILSLFGALAYAELGTMMPHSGGQYVYLREAYGPLAAFVCGCTLFLAIQAGAAAAVAVGFGIYVSYLFPEAGGLRTLAPGILICLLTAVNYLGIRGGMLVQKTFTVLKMLGIALLIGSALWGSSGDGPIAAAAAPIPSGSQIGLAMLGCFVAYEGWHFVGFIAGEVRNPDRNLPLSLVLGVATVTGIYLLTNAAYMGVLPLEEIAATERVAAAAAERTMGPLGATIVTLTIILSSVGCANGTLITSPRIYFAQARDGLLFAKLGEIHPRFETPGVAILAQGVWTALLAVSGSYETLVSYMLFAAWVFHAMTVLAVIILRVKYPQWPRPYRMWGYPATPLLFIGFSLWLVLNTLIERPGPSFMGAMIMGTAIPVYWIWKWRQASS